MEKLELLCHNSFLLTIYRFKIGSIGEAQTDYEKKGKKAATMRHAGLYKIKVCFLFIIITDS